MVQPRAGKGTRVIESDDEDDVKHWQAQTEGDSGSKSRPISSRIRHETNGHGTPKPDPASQTPTPQKSPDRSKSKPKPTAEKAVEASKAKSKTMHSFFNAATEAQRRREFIPLQSQGLDIKGSEEDIDDVSEDEAVQASRPSTNGRKRSSDVMASFPTISQNARKYFKTFDGSKAEAARPMREKPVEEDTRAWNERYGPVTLEELVVHKKKVSDTRQWLHASLHGERHRRLLVLKGAAGSGKTATMAVLSKTLVFDIVDWKNPAISDFVSGDYVSLSSQFEDFLGRGHRFGGLDIVTTAAIELCEPRLEGNTKNDESRRQVLMIEEFPSNLQHSIAATQAFRSCILQFISNTSSSSVTSTPLVIIVSESKLSSSSSSADSFTAHRLLGPEILHHPSTTVLDYNVVAPTFISKALNIVLQKRSRDVGRYYAPHPDVLKKLSEFGDVRNATSTLEFVCANAGDAGVETRIATKPSKTKNTKKKTTADRQEDEAQRDTALALVSLRESTIGLFHAVGKVMYNKRSVNSPEGLLPDHLRLLMKPLESEVDVESLIDETGTDTSTFLSALHENYPLSCTPADGNPEFAMDAVNGCLGSLGDADIQSNIEAARSNPYVSAGEELRQADLAFHVGVKGLLFSLPHPVKRQTPPGRSKGDAFRMFYPAGLKLYKEKEEQHDLLRMLTARAMIGTLHSQQTLRANHSTKAISQPGRTPAAFETPEPTAKDIVSKAIPLGSGHSAVQEMLLQRLPYIARLLDGAGRRESDLIKNQIQRVTYFTGLRVPRDDEDDEVDGAAPAFTNLPLRELASNQGVDFIGAPRSDIPTGEQEKTQNLVLSDDDIEDD